MRSGVGLSAGCVIDRQLFKKKESTLKAKLACLPLLLFLLLLLLLLR